MGRFMWWCSGGIFVGFSRALPGHAPDGKGMRRSGVPAGDGRVFIVAGTVFAALMVAEQADIDGGEQCEHEGLNHTDEKLHEVEHEHEAGAVEKVFAAEDVSKKAN